MSRHRVSAHPSVHTVNLDCIQWRAWRSALSYQRPLMSAFWSWWPGNTAVAREESFEWCNNQLLSYKFIAEQIEILSDAPTSRRDRNGHQGVGSADNKTSVAKFCSPLQILIWIYKYIIIFHSFT